MKDDEECDHDDDMNIQEEVSSEDSLLALICNQQEAVEMLSSIFRTLNMKAIDDP
jgi:hypothetical protein